MARVPRIAAVFVALVALMAGSIASADASAALTEPKVPAELQAQFRSLTGIRAGEPTLIAGALLNATDAPLDATVRISDLPAGVALADVRPSLSAPENGRAWSCRADECALVDTDGRATRVPGRDGVEMLLSFTTGAAVDPTATVKIAVNDAAPATVSLAVPAGETARVTGSLVVDLIGPTTLMPGVIQNSTATVTNVGSQPTDPGTLVLEIVAPAIDGVVVGASGADWSCDGAQCTYAGSLAPLTSAPPVTIGVTAPTTATATAASPLSVRASATTAGQAVDATHAINQSAKPPSATAISARIAIDVPSVAAPALVMATATITPTGRGDLNEPVRVTLDVPKHLSIEWAKATGAGWSCTAEDASCRATSPLLSGTPSTIAIPIAVAESADPGTKKLAVRAVVANDDDRADAATADLVVVPPPVPEIRAALTAATGTPSPAVDGSGAAITFAAAESREVAVVVRNDGSRPARAGSKLSVTITPDHEQRVESAGDRLWSCDPGRRGTIDHDNALHCEATLDTELASNATMTFPMRLGPTNAGSSEWRVRAGLDGKEQAQAESHYRIVVEPTGPVLVPRIVVGRPPLAGATGELVVDVANRGTRSAAGGVAIIALPAGLELVGVDSPAWTCVDGALRDHGGPISCATETVIEPSTDAAPIVIEVAPRPRTKDARVSAWASAPGQYHDATARASTEITVKITQAASVHAGHDLTVVTPQRGPDGVERPAIVVLQGDADLASAPHLTWTQRCTTAGEVGCDGITPAVTWLDVPAGTTPTTRTARFVAPTITSEVTLQFRLSAQHGSRTVDDDVTVRLVPAAIADASTSTRDDRTSTTTSTAAAESTSSPTSTSSGATTTSGAPGSTTARPTAPATTNATPSASTAPAPPPTASVGDGSTLQVATRTAGQLIGSGTGSGTLTYAWKQTAGPTATIATGAASRSTLVFAAPSLEPTQQSVDLTFQLAVTDSTGRTATATSTVDVVWGDDGLQVQLANGATNVVASVDAPVVVTSTVDSAGAPYTYAWSVSGVALPSGTATNAATLSFTSGPQAATGTATLTVTDSFGRVTTESVSLTISAVPGGNPPAAFCSALTDFAAGTPVTLTGPSMQVQIPNATVSGATSSSCPETATASFTTAVITLPGGIAITGAAGQLSVAGATITKGDVSGPANWGTGALTIPSAGLLLPFTSSTALGVPYGAITASGIPLIAAPNGWTGSTTITFTATPAPAAVLTASASSSTAGTAIQLTGTTTDAGATQLELHATGLVGIGTVDIPLRGSVSTSGPTSAVATSIAGSLADPTALGADITVTAATALWSPSGAGGTVTLAVGGGSAPITLQADATFGAGGDVTASFASGASPWTPTAGAPTLAFAGTGAITSGQLTLALTAAPAAPWSIGRDLVLNDLASTINANCAIGAVGCAPAVAVSATASSSAAASTDALTGSLDLATQSVTLAGSIGTLSIAPASVTSASLSVAITPSGAPTATASGTSTVMGASRAATVTFGPTATVMAAPIGAQTIVTGWTIPSATVFATDAPTTYTPPSGALSGQVTADLTPGGLVGIGVTQLPASLSTDVLPTSATTALASFDVTNGAPTNYLLEIPDPNDWYLAGSAGAAMALEVTSIGFDVAVTNGTATVSAGGSGVLTTAAIAAGIAPPGPQPLSFTGTLASSSSGAALTLNFTSASPWSNAFGVAGFDVDSVAVQSTVTAAATTVTLSGTAALPTALANPLGIPANAAPPVTADLTSSTPCAVVDLDAGGATGVDIGSADFVSSPSASLVLAPNGCTANTINVGAGLTLLLGGGLLGTVNLPVNPTTFGITDQIEVASIPIGGLTLTNATIDVQIGGGTPSITVAGTTTIDGTDLAMSGAVQFPAAGSSTAGTITLTASASALPLGWLDVSGVTVSVTSQSIASAGVSTVALTGSFPILGGSVPLTLQGQITSGTIDTLAAVVPSTTYTLPATDTLTTALTVTYNAAGTPTLLINNPSNGVLQTPTRQFVDVGVNVTAAGFTMTSGWVYIASSLTPTLMSVVTGPYPIGGSSAGAYDFANASSITAVLAGYTAPTDVTFVRTKGAESATQSSTLTLGLFDQDTAITVTGALATNATATLTGSAGNVTFRGLSGTASISVSPSTTQPAAPAVAQNAWYDANITFATTAGECALWSGAPTLVGQTYRSGTTTYYTLTGSVTLGLPDGLSFGAIPGQSEQPLVLSNELNAGEMQPATGLTLNLGMASAAFTGVGMVSFDLSNCSWSIGGFLQFNFGGNPIGNGLENAFQSVPPVSDNVGNLFGGSGTLPESIAVSRADLQEQALTQALATAVAQNYATAQTLQGEAEQAQQDLVDAQTQLAEAESARGDAQAAYDQAWQDLQTAENQVTALDAVNDASSRLNAAANSVNAAQAQADQAEQTLNEANESADDAATDLANARDDFTTAQQDAIEAADAADAFDDQVQKAEQKPALQVNFSFSHCLTCTPVDTFTISGEFFFVNTYVFGLDLDIGFSGSGLDSITGTISGGLEKQFNAGFGPVGLYAMASLVVDVTAGYDFGQGWAEASFAITLTAQVDAYVNFWCCSLSATLADVTGEVELAVIPSVTASGYISFDVFGFSGNANFGPDAL